MPPRLRRTPPSRQAAWAAQKWFTARLAEMEAELGAFGLPGDVWNELWLVPRNAKRVANPADPCLIIGPAKKKNAIAGKSLARRVVGNPLDTDTLRALWTAAIALTCAESTKLRSSESGLLLGRLLERFERWRTHPEESSAALQAALRAADEAERAKLEREAQTGRPVLDGASEGGRQTAEPYQLPRDLLWNRWLAEQPIGHNEFCRLIEKEEPKGIAPQIVGYDNIRHHLRVAKKENGWRPGETPATFPNRSRYYRLQHDDGSRSNRASRQR